MEFSVLERLILLGVVQLGAPDMGSLVTMRIVHNLNMSLGFLESEIAEKNLVIHEDGRATWEEGALIDVEIGPVARDIIQKGLTIALPEWDKAEALTVTHIKLFEEFDVDMDLPEPEPEEVEVEEVTED